jgi:hypothetical protein
MTAPESSPRLTVEAFAELMTVPGYEYRRILYDHKYPKKIPASFMVPYYRDAIAAIIEFYRQGNNPEVLTKAILGLEETKSRRKRYAPKDDRNIEVLRVFSGGSLRERQFRVQKANTYRARIGTVGLKFSPDVTGVEDGKTRFLVLNPRMEDTDDEVARMTLEIAHHVLAESAVPCSMNELEYANIRSGKTTRGGARLRKRTLDRAVDTAKVIGAYWDTI